jgi:hypothetical protein
MKELATLVGAFYYVFTVYKIDLGHGHIFIISFFTWQSLLVFAFFALVITGLRTWYLKGDE